MKKTGILTSGSDAPSMNARIKCGHTGLIQDDMISVPTGYPRKEKAITRQAHRYIEDIIWLTRYSIGSILTREAKT